jgi:hypothetical protein
MSIGRVVPNLGDLADESINCVDSIGEPKHRGTNPMLRSLLHDEPQLMEQLLAGENIRDLAETFNFGPEFASKLVGIRLKLATVTDLCSTARDEVKGFGMDFFGRALAEISIGDAEEMSAEELVEEARKRGLAGMRNVEMYT